MNYFYIQKMNVCEKYKDLFFWTVHLNEILNEIFFPYLITYF